MSDALFGREAETQIIGQLPGATGGHGQALLLTGDPGMGKSALLRWAAQAATAAGGRVLQVTGVQFEAEVSFAGLDRLLRSLRPAIADLPAAYRDALLAVLGLRDGGSPGRLAVLNGTLALLRQAAQDRALLVIVDDMQWLDRASAAVCAGVARRLTGSRIGFLAAARSGADDLVRGSGLPEIELKPLDHRAAARAISVRFPALAPSVRRRVLDEAAGNPLALMELPAALTGAQRDGLKSLPPLLPLNDRLAELFASRVAALPAPTRRLLLIAALHGPGDLSAIHAAAGSGRGADLAPAERAGLVVVHDQTRRLTFCHPLVRSTVVEGAAAAERRRAHWALADAVADRPERRAWHLAEAAARPDEHVAGLLEQAAQLSLRRGDAVGAVAALTRAATLSTHPARRSRRLVEAAYLEADVTGALRNAPVLLDDARLADPDVDGSLQAAATNAYLLLNGDGAIRSAHRLMAGSFPPGPQPPAGPPEAFAEALHTLMLVCFFGGRAELWEPFDDALSRLGAHVPVTLQLSSTTLRDPAHSPPPALQTLDAAIAGLCDATDPTHIVRIGMAAFYVDRLAACREPFRRVIASGRAGGAVASSIDALALLCFDGLATGRWEEAQRLADEAVALCEARGYQLLSWPGRLAQALLAAGRGDTDTVRSVTDAMDAWAAPREARVVEDYARHARALAAAGSGDFQEAYRQAAGISPPGALPPGRAHAVCVLLDLVEAAVRTGRLAEARAHVAAMRKARIAGVSPRLALVSAGCAAMVAPADQGSSRYAMALAVPGAQQWPFELARIRLCFGEHLRRTTAVAGSRLHLKAALDIFERLGALPWAARAAEELRAAGLVVTRPLDGDVIPLTAQERHIAALAASGLTNRQIAQRLHLSHRTVGGHLYQVFPKLGVTSRAALADALAALPRPDP